VDADVDSAGHPLVGTRSETGWCMPHRRCARHRRVVRCDRHPRHWWWGSAANRMFSLLWGVAMRSEPAA